MFTSISEILLWNTNMVNHNNCIKFGFIFTQIKQTKAHCIKLLTIKWDDLDRALLNSWEFFQAYKCRNISQIVRICERQTNHRILIRLNQITKLKWSEWCVKSCSSQFGHSVSFDRSFSARRHPSLTYQTHIKFKWATESICLHSVWNRFF